MSEENFEEGTEESAEESIEETSSDSASESTEAMSPSADETAFEESSAQGFAEDEIAVDEDPMETTQMEGESMEEAMARAMAEERGQSSPQPEPRAIQSESLRSRISNDMNLDTLLKVPVSLSIEVGRTKMPLSELLETQEGSVIELERLLDEPLDILVNGALIAHGVVVLANDRFGIQITDIVSPQERVLNI